MAIGHDHDQCCRLLPAELCVLEYCCLRNNVFTKYTSRRIHFLSYIHLVYRFKNIMVHLNIFLAITQQTWLTSAAAGWTAAASAYRRCIDDGPSRRNDVCQLWRNRNNVWKNRFDIYLMPTQCRFSNDITSFWRIHYVDFELLKHQITTVVKKYFASAWLDLFMWKLFYCLSEAVIRTSTRNSIAVEESTELPVLSKYYYQVGFEPGSLMLTQSTLADRVIATVVRYCTTNIMMVFALYPHAW